MKITNNQNPENSIDKTEYPDDSTFEYDPKTPVDTTKPGDYTVNVIVKDKEGNPIAEVPATVRVVESYPQFVPVDKDKKHQLLKEVLTLKHSLKTQSLLMKLQWTQQHQEKKML